MSSQPQSKPSLADQSPAGNFIAMLQGKTGGTSLYELDDKLAECVRAVRSTGKPAKLTYTVIVKSNGKRGVEIIDDVKIKTADEDKGRSFFFANDQGALLRNNPEGPDLPGLHVIPDEKPAPVAVSV